MRVLVAGLNYRGVPLDLLGRFAFDGEALPKALAELRGSDAVSEAVILSTCNRIEIYAAVDGFHAGVAALQAFLSEFHHVEPGEFSDRLYRHYEEDAAAHLYAVACGIDSMVVGEPQILRQVRQAFRVASEEGAAGPVLSALFRRAIAVGRRARAETGIARSARTFAHAGAELARATAGTLDGATVLVIGAGKMSDLSAAELAAQGASILVANRTLERAQRVAARTGGEAVALDDLERALARADLVLSSTGSPDPVITAEAVARAMAGRPERPMVLLDLALPRDIEPGAGAVANVILKDLDDMRESVAPTAEQLSELDRVRALVAEEVPKFVEWRRVRSLSPALSALQSRAEEIRERELNRALPRLGSLTDAERSVLDAMTRSIVAKLLHDPVATLKAKAGTDDGEAIAAALRELFAIPEE